MAKTKVKLSEVENGETFITDDGIEYIKFSESDGVSVVLTKEILFISDFGSNNNLAESKILKRLQNEILSKIEDAVGCDNVIEFKTDLTSLDGLKTYGEISSKISLPTLNFYRENVDIFDKYKVNKWFWLATPESTKEHLDDVWALCVAPSGDIYGDGYSDRNGVRPVLCLKSSIFVSFEK